MQRIQELEKYLPADDPEALPSLSHRVAKNSTVIFLGQVFSLAANLVVTVLLARHLGKAGFGLFSYALVFVSVFAIFADFGMPAILVREFSRRQWNPVELLGNAFIFRTVLSIGAIVLIILSAWIAGYSATLFKIITILALNILVTSKLSTVRAVFEAPFNASLQMQVPMLLQLLDSLLLVGITFALSQSGANLQALIIGYSVSNLPGFLLIIFSTVRQIPLRLAINHNLIRFLIKESFPLLIYTILTTLFVSVDILLLKELRGEDDVGLYSAALRLASPLLFIPQGIAVSLFPLLSRYYEQSKEKLSMVFRLGMKVILVVALVLAIVTTFFASEIIHMLYSQEYHASARLLIILMWSQVFVLLNFYFANALTSVNRQQITLYAATAMLLINGLASWILIQVLEVQGAAIARFISSVVGASMQLVAINRVFVFQFGRLFLRLAVFGVLFGGVLTLLSRAPISIFLFGPIVFLLILAIIWRFFNKDERMMILSLIRASSRASSPRRINRP